ncbi:MAG: hypothetical protein AB1Z23_07720 [Eubacteriales bacterium]
MNKLKKFIIVVLSILMVLTSVIAWAGCAVRLGALNPIVYSKLMPSVNAFDSLYESFVDYLLQPLEAMEIPAEVQGVPEDLVMTAIPKDDFNKTVGKFVGDTIGMLLYRHHEVDIPIEGYVEKLYSTIKNDPRVINSETNIEATMNAIVAQKLGAYVFKVDGYDQTLGGLIYVLMGENSVYWIDTFFPYWGIRLSIIAFASLGLMLVLFVLLMILNTEKRYRSIMLAKILCIFYAVVNVLAAGAIYILPSIAAIFSKLASYEKIIVSAKTIFNSFAYLAVGFAVVLIISAIILHKAQKKSYARMPSAY